MTDKKWWCVCDKDEPDYGAHVVLAVTEALKEGYARWYNEVGGGHDRDPRGRDALDSRDG